MRKQEAEATIKWTRSNPGARRQLTKTKSFFFPFLKNLRGHDDDTVVLKMSNASQKSRTARTLKGPGIKGNSM